MVSSQRLSPTGRAYVSAVVTLGFLVVSESLYRLASDPPTYQWFLLAALTLISGSATVKLPASYASISISETFVFTAVLLYGPAAGTIIVALDGLVASFWIAKRHREAYRALFNMSAPALSAWCSSQLFFIVSGTQPLTNGPATLNQILPGLVLFAITYFGINSWLIAFVIALEKHLDPVRVWRTTLLWLSLNYFCGASVAVLLVSYNRTIDVGYIGVIVPLLLVLYFTFKTAMGRVEDADRHVEQLNRLYLSTIETLAMAIDAKDQVTHGHIRRVQAYAVGLAKRVGVVDEQLIKAIEAAALLHDTGKLAVPEYILNKPGKLTPAEFDKMKLHATVGADILAAIDFPYPVVPIVRHHHENWDGSGYPAGLKGTDIPIGARILSVVDCFDALTSDRPYRPRLSDEQALGILTQRRGTMYDPLIVDTFSEVHEELAHVIPDSPPAEFSLDSIASSSQPNPITDTRFEEITASADEMLTLYEIAQALAGQASVSDTGDVIAKHLRRLIPSSMCVFYLYNTGTDEIEAVHASGDTNSIVSGLRIPLGQRLSGWVAANRQTIVNSDPVLDLGEVARAITPRLRSCISTPMLCEDTLIGVLTLYSSTHDGFSDDHRRVLEAVSKQIAHTIRTAAEFNTAQRKDPGTGLPGAQQLHSVAELNSAKLGNTTSIIVIQISDTGAIDRTHGAQAVDEILRHVAERASAALRVADFLFRYSDSTLIALLTDTDAGATEDIRAKIEQRVAGDPVSLKSGRTVDLQIEVSCLTASQNGPSVFDLLRLAGTTASPEQSSPKIH